MGALWSGDGRATEAPGTCWGGGGVCMGRGYPCVCSCGCAHAAVVPDGVYQCPSMQVGGVCIPPPPIPHSRHPRDICRAGHGNSGLQHGDTPWDGARRCTPMSDKPPKAKVGGDWVPPQAAPPGCTPLTCQGAEGEEKAVAAHGGAAGRRGQGSTRPLTRQRSGPGARWDRTGQLSPATVSCSQQPQGPARDG